MNKNNAIRSGTDNVNKIKMMDAIGVAGPLWGGGGW